MGYFSYAVILGMLGLRYYEYRYNQYIYKKMLEGLLGEFEKSRKNYKLHMFCKNHLKIIELTKMIV